MADDPSRSGISRSHSNLASAHSDASRPPDNYRAPAKPVQGPYVNDVSMPPSYSQSPAPKPRSNVPLPITPSRSPSVTIAPPSADPNDIPRSQSPYRHPDHDGQYNVPSKSNTLPIPPSTPMDAKRRSSYDNGVRPLNILPNKRSDSLAPENGNLHSGGMNGSASDGLSVTSRHDKRRSFNHGLSLPVFKESPPTQSGNLSPRHASFSTQERNGTANSPYLTAHDQSSQITFTTSRSPSRSGSAHSSHSTKNLDADQSISRSSSFRTNHYDDSQDDTIMMSPPSMAVPLGDDTGPSSTSNAQANKARHGRNSGGLNAQRSSATLSPTDTNGFHTQRRGSSASNFGHERHGASSSSRSASPAYRADVPHGIESGTDTEPENEPDNTSFEGHDSQPPAPPPKDAKSSTRSSTVTVADLSMEPDASDTSQTGDMSDDMGESEAEAVERTTRTTYIAPALPPIRFSVNADFGDMLSATLLRSLEDNTSKSPKAKIPELQPSTPPPTAALLGAHNQDATPTGATGTQANESPPPNTSSLADVLEELDADDLQDSAAQIPPSQNGIRLVTESSDPTPTIVLPTARRADAEPESLIQTLREDLNHAKKKGAQHINVDIDVAETIITHLEARNKDYTQLKNKVDGLNVSSIYFSFQSFH
jgi:hypothetical protein